MFYEFDTSRGGFIIAKAEILFVPQFKALYDGYGWDAIQYMLYFGLIQSPFYHMDEESRNFQCKQAVEKEPWEQGGKLPDRLFEDPLFKFALKELPNHDDNMEAEQESALHELRADAIRYVKTLKIESVTDRKEIIEILSTLDTLTKQHRETKKALADRLATDDGVALTMHDVR